MGKKGASIEHIHTLVSLENILSQGEQAIPQPMDDVPILNLFLTTEK